MTDIKHDSSHPSAANHKPHRVRLTAEDVEHLRVAYSHGISKKDLAEHYGCHPQTVRNIVTGNSYPNLPGPIVGSPRWSSRRTRIAEEDIIAIREMAAAGASAKVIAKAFGRHHATVRDVITGRRYPEVPGPTAPLGPAAGRERNWMTDEEILQIRTLAHQGTPLKDIAAEYNRHIYTVRDLVAGRIHPDRPGPIAPTRRWLSRSASQEEMRTYASQVLAEDSEIMPNGCIQIRNPGTQGYAQYTIGGESWDAHRLAYWLYVGELVDGLVIDHMCHNLDLTCPGGATCSHRSCINPADLQQVTRSENISAARKGVRSRRAPLCENGHSQIKRNTVERALPGGSRVRVCRPCEALGIQLGADPLPSDSAWESLEGGGEQTAA